MTFDFGYPWWLSWGQVVFLIPALALSFLAWKFRWALWTRVFFVVVVMWSAAALTVTHFVIDVDGVPALPTENFFSAGAGRVLDLGAGTGRSSIMVLRARPQATLVALDLFGDSFDQHFGHSETPEEKLLVNLRKAGVAERASIQKADMRVLPFEAASFDAIVSAYAVDHLNREGIGRSLTEAARVVKPGGDFLLILVGKEMWGQFAFGPLLSHMGGRRSTWWAEQLQKANFEVKEEGVKPITLYLLARRR